MHIYFSQKYSGSISEETGNKVWIKCVSPKAGLLLYTQLTEDVKDEFQPVLESLNTLMFMCLTR